MELTCKVQNYAWGVPGLRSCVAQLRSSSDSNFKVEELSPYAELWMGTHTNGPSIIKENGESLLSYIKKYPQCLGSNMREKFGDELSFLFKILSVNQALSIQAHPNKSHAEQLHKDRPDLYKDPNHKPELAIALTHFQALCGFRPAEEIKQFMEELDELRQVIGDETVQTFISNPSEDSLKSCFSALMATPKEVVGLALQSLAKRLELLDESKGDFLLKDLFLTLYRQYPGDGGCFSIYLMNFIVLEPGEAIFCGPNIIHAYLKGDCVECMACSDNVVRAGLTPKFQDVKTLTQMLEYRMVSTEKVKFPASVVNEYTSLFNPPVPDFAVYKIKTETSREVVLSGAPSASIVIVVEGAVKRVRASPANSGDVPSPGALKRGFILFIEAEQSLIFETEGSFLAFRAICI